MHKRPIARSSLFCLFFLAIHPGFLFAQDRQAQTTVIADSFEVPWDLVWANESELFVTERGGKLWRVTTADGSQTLLWEQSVAAETHSGLMGMDLHPQWPDSAYVYVMYSYYTGSFAIRNRVVKLAYDAQADTLTESQVILDNLPGSGTTTGGRILISPAGELFVSIGDLDQGAVAQDTNSLAGKILRVQLDGSIPADNPFPGSPIWSLGHRNVQGLALTDQGVLFASEHGPSTTDEINRIEKGRNYGWPLVLGPCDASSQATCDSLNIQGPDWTWGSPPIAPAGMAFLPDSVDLFGNAGLIMASLRGNKLWYLGLNEAGDSVMADKEYLGPLTRLRDVAVSPGGRIAICTSNRDQFGSGSSDPGNDYILEVQQLPAATIDDQLALPATLATTGRRQWRIQFAEGFPGGSLSVMSLDGRTVQHRSLRAGARHAELRLPEVPSGVYLLRVHHQNQQFLQRIICR